MTERMALSTIFWSAAREEDGIFFFGNCQFLLLSVCTCGESYLWLLALLEELGLTGLLGGSITSKVLVAGDLLDLLGIDTRDIDLVGGGDNVAGVDAADWDTVDLEWASNEENTLVKVVQEDDALATETASEEDENGSWDEGSAWSGGTDGLADLEKSRLAIVLLSASFQLHELRMSECAACCVYIVQIVFQLSFSGRTTWLVTFAHSLLSQLAPKSHLSKRTFLWTDSSSAGYHLEALLAAAGTSRVALPKVLVVGADILTV